MPCIPDTALPNSNCVFNQDFSGPVSVAKANGVLSGSPSFVPGGGISLNGVDQYVSYYIPNTLLSHPSITIICEFIPDFDWDDGNTYFLFDSTSSNRYLLFKEASDKITLYLGNIEVASILGGAFGSYWFVNEKNTVVVSGEPGSTNMWLNGNQILTNDITAWSPKIPTEFRLGVSNTGTAPFDGTIKSFSVHSRLFDSLDVQNMQNNSLYNFF